MEVQPQVKIKGFRTGKAPIQLVAEIHGASVWREFAPAFLDNVSTQAIESKNLKVAGTKKVNVKHFSPRRRSEICTLI